MLLCLVLLAGCALGLSKTPTDDDDSAPSGDDDSAVSDDDDSGNDDDDAGNNDDDDSGTNEGDDDSSPTNGDNIEGDQPGECSDGEDNDADGLLDCTDPSCWNSTECGGDDDTGGDDDDTGSGDDDTGSGDDDTGSGDDDTAPFGDPPVITNVTDTWLAAAQAFEFVLSIEDPDCNLSPMSVYSTVSGNPEQEASNSPLAWTGQQCNFVLNFTLTLLNQLQSGQTLSVDFRVTDGAGNSSNSYNVQATVP